MELTMFIVNMVSSIHIHIHTLHLLLTTHALPHPHHVHNGPHGNEYDGQKTNEQSGHIGVDEEQRCPNQIAVCLRRPILW